MWVREYWNSTTRIDKIAVPTKALGIQRGTRSQSGVLIRVATALRDDAWLDAAWFEPNACDDARPLGAVASGALFEEPAGKTSVNSTLQKSAE